MRLGAVLTALVLTAAASAAAKEALPATSHLDGISRLQPDSCLTVLLHLQNSLEQYELTVRPDGDCAQELKVSLSSVGQAQDYDCRTAVVAESETAAEQGRLVLSNACPLPSDVAIEVARRHPRPRLRASRRLTYNTNGPNNSGGSQGAAANSTSTAVPAQAPTMQPAKPGPNVEVSCCCESSPFPNAPGGQYCSCGPEPCGGVSFCSQQDCTAILVGCLLIGTVLLTCAFVAFWYLRARAMRRRLALSQAQNSSRAAPVNGPRRRHRRHRSRGSVVVPMRRVPTKPAPEGAEGLPRECPVCMEEIASYEAWIMFQCDHGTCVDCYTKLLQRPLHAAACPLCRTPLLEAIPEDALPSTATEDIVYNSIPAPLPSQESGAIELGAMHDRPQFEEDSSHVVALEGAEHTSREPGLPADLPTIVRQAPTDEENPEGAAT